ASLSPFKLEPLYTTSPSANGQRICFTVAPVQRCPAEEPCCSQADFYKLEIRVYGLARDMALFKLPRLNLTTTNATGAKICITLRDPCPNMAALCPEGDGSCTYAVGQSAIPHKCCPVNKLSLPPPPPPAVPLIPGVSIPPPPPPPPPKAHVRAAAAITGSSSASSSSSAQSRRPAPYTGTFPYTSNCNQTSGLMPFRLAAPVLSRTISGGNVYCFSLESSTCADPSSSCCSSNLLRVDWWSYDTCRGSVRAYVDKVSYPVTWDQGGTFRLTKLNYSRDEVASRPKQLCIELRKDGPCDTLGRFCRLGESSGSCTYALYDGAQTCCPTGATPGSSR
ncbi:hypothetical protein VOLCADRAFT_116986, partial [Volvox carteri f. nagariensis]